MNSDLFFSSPIKGSFSFPGLLLTHPRLIKATRLRFWMLLIPLSLIFFAAFYYALSLAVQAERIEISARTQAAIEKAKEHANHDFETIYGDLRYLSESQRIPELLQRPDDIQLRRSVEKDLLDLVKTHALYDQVRVLSVQGKELVRVDYHRGAPVVVDQKQLQNKASRYYFHEAIKIPPGQIYISKLDLNVENGAVELPYKPMIRFAKPLYGQHGEIVGLLVINYLGEILLEHFRQHMEELDADSALINNEGYWLSHPDPKKEWGFMFGREETFAVQNPDVWAQIQAVDHGRAELDGRVFFFATVRPLVIETSASSHSANALNDWKIIIAFERPALNWGFVVKKLSYIYPLLLSYPLSLLLLWYWARASAGRALAEKDLKRLNTSLEQQVKDRTMELQATKDATIMSLASLAETRDNETGQHILRTQHYVKILGQALKEHPDFCQQLNDEVIELIYKSAPLHDIGKVGIPDSILLKPGKLTFHEFEIMKSHTILGSDALEQAINTLASSWGRNGEGTFLRYARDIAHYHHERWDGNGYPKGLRGDSIPLAARLMSVADVYDALVSERVYKPAFSREKTESIILEQSEGQFDPRVLDAFKRCREQFWVIKERYDEPVAPVPERA